LAAAALMLGASACGGGEPQDENEPEGEFPVAITTSDFPNRQRLAQTSELELAIRNAGDETIPNLTITISTDPASDDAFSIHSEQKDLAVPSRPVWILEHGFPKLAGESAPAGATDRRTKNFSFGPVEPGQTKDILWRLTPVVAGDYTVTYKVSAGRFGKAVAVTEDGNPPEGEFVVQITDVPPQTRVDEAGNVVPIDPDDLIGQAGSQQQREEVGGGGN
jgi:hypothetical protein